MTKSTKNLKKQLEITEEEKLGHLAEELLAIVRIFHDVARVEMFATKYRMGEAIASSPLYKKFGKNQGKLITELSGRTEIKPDTLNDCVKFYSEYPNQPAMEVAQKAFKEFGTWREARKALYGGGENRTCSEERETKCRHCSIHCPKMNQD